MRTSDLNITKLQVLQSIALLLASHEGIITLTSAETDFILESFYRGSHKEAMKIPLGF